MKWIELNVGIDPNNNRDALIEFVFPVVEKNRSKFQSWHFLWENKPWPILEKKGTTLRLRFYGEKWAINKLKEQLDKKLISLETEKPNSYFGHCYGRHGDCPGEYEGEDWGRKGWKLGMSFLQFGSEVALEFIRNENKLGKSDEYKLSKWRYVERYVHCFLDAVFKPEEEADFHLINTIQRLSLLTTGKQFGETNQVELFNDIKAKIIDKSKESFKYINKS
jgi:hypothetical protein